MKIRYLVLLWFIIRAFGKKVHVQIEVGVYKGIASSPKCASPLNVLTLTPQVYCFPHNRWTLTDFTDLLDLQVLLGV